MVRLTTATGREITLAPESIFGLSQESGEVWIQAPRLEHAELSAFETRIDPDNVADWRLWYGVGMIMATGVFSDSESRPARMVLPADRRWELEKYSDFLKQWADLRGLRNAFGEPWEIKIKDMGESVSLQSRVLDLILTGPCADFLHPVTLVPNPEQAVFARNRSARKGFVSGVLGGMEITFEGRVITHKHADVVRWLNHFLFWRCAVPTELRINPHEPTITAHTRRVKNPHSLLLKRDHYLFAQQVGLSHWDRDLLVGGKPLNNLSGRYTDRIVSITPAGEQEAIEVIGDNGTVSLNGFQSKLIFDVPHEALTLASMSELFVDVDDPEAVLAAAPVHMTHKHGEI